LKEENNEGRAYLLPYSQFNYYDDNILMLSLNIKRQESLGICSSLSNGRVIITNENSELLSEWKAHDLEVWHVNYDLWNENLLFTGSDDCKLKCWDLRIKAGQSIMKKRFDMGGVTAIENHPEKENILFTGSYDENIYVWDQRNFKNPTSIFNAGGGVWRLKWKDPETLLAACMYNGAKIIKCDTSWELTSIVDYHEHQSIVYGIDWIRGEKNFIVSCSFYDHSLHLWKLEKKSFLFR